MAVVSEFIVMTLPDVPETVQVVTVVVVPLVNKIEWAAPEPLLSSLKSAKVLDPETVIDPVLVPEAAAANQMLLYVFPPPANVLAVAEPVVSASFMVEVAEVKTPLAPIDQTVPVPVSNTVEA